MEPPNQNDDDGFFYDALDDFPSHDCIVTGQSAHSTSTSTLSDYSPDTSSTVSALRPRSISHLGIKDAHADSSLIGSNALVIDDPGKRRRANRLKLYHDLKGNKRNLDGAESTRSISDRVGARRADSSAVGVVDPFGAIRRGRGFIVRKLVSLWNLVGGFFGSFLDDWLKEHKTIWSLLMQFGWGLFWSCYVCVILCGLLVFSVMLSGFLMRYLVEEPIKIRQDLNFDYTKDNPVANVPIQSCGGVACCEENIGDFKSLNTRVIPPNHKLQVSVLLTLPESEYNRNLGVFQIRADFLSADGKTLASKSHPSILKFRSEPIRFLLTFLKAAPLVAGYISESQTLALKIKGFTECDVPTSCLKVIIGHRAEYRHGAGIPEIYDASIVLESELPLLKRIIWPVIIPRAMLRDGSAINNSTPNDVPAQS
ncbi:hypothetical protein D5086_021589 [Populus alba]|uniref:Uncharacterized protein n=1 Tax=Populus alba TaxID=43335 RepID=A0ACC4BDF8_POPAL